MMFMSTIKISMLFAFGLQTLVTGVPLQEKFPYTQACKDTDVVSFGKCHAYCNVLQCYKNDNSDVKCLQLRSKAKVPSLTYPCDPSCGPHGNYDPTWSNPETAPCLCNDGATFTITENEPECDIDEEPQESYSPEDSNEDN
jgi:hypothetical protein